MAFQSEAASTGPELCELLAEIEDWLWLLTESGAPSEVCVAEVCVCTAMRWKNG